MTNCRTVFEEELSLLVRLYKKALFRTLFLCLTIGIVLPGILLWIGQNDHFSRNLFFAIGVNALILIRFWIYPQLKLARTQNHIVQKATLLDNGSIVLTTFSSQVFFRKHAPKEVERHPHSYFVYDKEHIFLDRRWKQ